MRVDRWRVWGRLVAVGDAGALDRILPLVYAKLRAVAGAQLRDERTGHTLSATALVHEAYVRLAGRERMAPRDRSHFFAMAAQSMRRVLIDHARSRQRQKRGLGLTAVSLDRVEGVVGGGGSRRAGGARAWLRKEIAADLDRPIA